MFHLICVRCRDSTLSFEESKGVPVVLAGIAAAFLGAYWPAGLVKRFCRGWRFGL